MADTTTLHNDPKLAATTALILERLWPSLDAAMGFQRERRTDDSDAAAEAWISGAVFGALHTYIRTAGPEDVPVPDAAQMAVMYGTLLEMIDEVFESDPPSLDAALRRLVPDAFAGEEADHG